MPSVLRVEGKLDLIKLEKAFEKLIARHETLRTSFDMVGDEPVQRIHENIPFKIEYAEIGAESIKERIEGLVKPFDLKTAPLLRANVIRMVEEETHLLFVDMHHIISDGTSTTIMVKEFTELYAGLVSDSLNGSPMHPRNELPELRIQ